VNPFLLALIIFALCHPFLGTAEPTPVANAAFESYIATVESRLAQQHGSRTSFLARIPPQSQASLRQGELMIEETTPPAGDPSGAMLHHWHGAAFVPGASAAGFEQLMRNFNAYPAHFTPQVEQARILSHQGDHYHVVLRVQQHHIITVVMDTTYDVTFGRLDAQRGYSLSHSTQISEIDSPGTSNERALKPGEDHGFLWRLNTYWTYEERDGGLYMEIESVSLTRSIPTGLGWIIGPFVQSVPRESLEFTLRSTCNALRK
jgi:hypothetical protein